MFIFWEEKAHKREGKVPCRCFWKSWRPASCGLLHVVLASTNTIPTCSFIVFLYALADEGAISTTVENFGYDAMKTLIGDTVSGCQEGYGSIVSANLSQVCLTPPNCGAPHLSSLENGGQLSLGKEETLGSCQMKCLKQ